MSERIGGVERKPRTLDEYDAPVPHGTSATKALPPDAPWLKEPAFGGTPSFAPEMLSNPSLLGGPSVPAPNKEWPTLPPLGAPSFAPIAKKSCERLVATPDNAHAFVERHISLRDALKDGAFGSASELERFIDDYVAASEKAPGCKALCDEARTVGPEILANRLASDEKDAERALEQQRMVDRVQFMQVRPPLIMQQRAAIGEVAIPIARAVTTIAKLAPIVGDLVVAAEVLTGRELAGLGEKMDKVDRAVDAALLLAPFAAKALGKGARGAAELLRLSRATGRSVSECRALCRTAVAVEKHRAALGEAIATAKSGGPLSSSQREALAAVSESAESVADGGLRQRTYKPSLTRDASLPAGAGWTDKYGNVGISPRGTRVDRALAHAHESVHSFLSPKAMNRFREFRANLSMAAYQKSEMFRFLEEALAETFAQVKVNGLRALPEGLSFPFRNGYVTVSGTVREGAAGTIVYGGVLYGVYLTVADDR